MMWNRCDVCGKFISMEDFDRGLASRVLLTPDSHSTKEEYETLCKDHNDFDLDHATDQVIAHIFKDEIK